EDRVGDERRRGCCRPRRGRDPEGHLEGAVPGDAGRWPLDGRLAVRAARRPVVRRRARQGVESPPGLMLAVDAVDVAAWPVAVAGVLTACGVIWRAAVRPVFRWGRRVEGALRTVEHELVPNSGRSLRDAVDRIEVRLARGDARF